MFLHGCITFHTLLHFINIIYKRDLKLRLCELYIQPLSQINFTVTPCINNIQHFNFQLIHTTLKNIELLKHFKISKTAPTCFGLQGNHHQGATIST